MIKEILLLGHPQLYQVSAPVAPEELADVAGWVADLHDTLMDYRHRYGAGRAIAAPQIGVAKRLIYMHIHAPMVLINPHLSFSDGEQYELLDDCMSFPGLLVRVKRYRRARIQYRDAAYVPREQWLDGDLSELLQHECDHLDGILATMRAVDDRALTMRPPRPQASTFS